LKVTVITSLYNCEKYLQGYFTAVNKIINKEECEFLLLHNAPTPQEIKAIQINIKDKPWFRHIIIDKREGLYTTWNRAIKLANGQYCAVWNVDDVRFPNSLAAQADLLDKNDSCGLVIGGLNGTDVYGETGQRYYKNDSIDNQPDEAYRSCILGCFPMWRKSIHDTIGYFDEQFRCASDFDFQIRVAIKYGLCRVNESLGIYLENDVNKISSDGAQIYENNLIYLRYGAYEKLILHKIPKSLQQYRCKSIINFNQVYRLNFNMPFNFSYRLTGLFKALVKWPYYIARDAYHLFR